MTSRELLGSCAPQQRTKDTWIEGRKQEALLKKHPFPWKVEFSSSNDNDDQRIKAFVTYICMNWGGGVTYIAKTFSRMFSLCYMWYLLHSTSCAAHVLDFHTAVRVLEL